MKIAQTSQVQTASVCSRGVYASNPLSLLQKKMPEVNAFKEPVKQDAVSSGSIVQCYRSIRFANLDEGTAKYATKATDIIQSLLATPRINAFLADKNVLITLETDPQLASVRTIGDQVQITLSPWFFEQQSRGRILGMLAHEFGVHPLAGEAMNIHQHNAEQNHIAGNTNFATGLPGHTINPGAAGQVDHIFAALHGQPRFEIYRDTVFQMAVALHGRTQGGGATATTVHVTDLIMTYLSDIAMIIATNDHRREIWAQADRTAAAFNLVRGNWNTFLGTQGPNGAILLGLTPNVKTAENVKQEVKNMIKSYFASAVNRAKDDDKKEQTKTGIFSPVYSDLSAAQRGVLQDYGLTLRAKVGAQPGFFDAYAGATAGNAGVDRVHVITAMDNRITHLRGLGVRNQNEAYEFGLLPPIVNAVRTNSLPAVIDNETLNGLAWALGASVRIIQPNGKVLMPGFVAGMHPVTLLQVPQPSPHYRYAT